MEEIMLRIDNVSKQYTLGEIGSTTLYWELQRLHARMRGREDPTKKIGAKDYNNGDKFLALDSVSFDVMKGERVGIIGHNGAGKSTLLKLISRVTAPTTGMIGLNGRVACMLEVGTGFHQELTGRENIYMNGAILGMTKKEIDAKMEDIIEFSECRQFIDTPVKRYSSGMYVKLAFSVAAHLDSEIMIMDEVLAVGDMAFQKKCLDKMSEVSKTQDRTILYVSHNMNTIRQLCDRVVLLDHGKVVYDGRVEEGINCYLGGNTEFISDVSILPFMREIKCESRLKINRLLSNNKECIYKFGSELQFTLYISNHYDCERSCYLRAIIHASSGDPVAMCHSDKPLNLSVGNQNIKKFLLDISQIVPGDYYLDLVLIDYGQYGAEKRMDALQHVYRFRIVQTDGFNLDKDWYKEGWGYINNGALIEVRE